MRIRYQTAAVLFVGLSMGLVTSGCFDRELKPLDPCLISGVVEKVKARTIENIDLLFMVDNTPSMIEEQEALLRELPYIVEILASGDVDGDGQLEFTPVKSLQVGVVTPDMGNGGVFTNIAACDSDRGGMRDPYVGDDGQLITRGNAARPGCSASYPRFLEFQPGGAQSADNFAGQFTCVADVGTLGCPYELVLESVLKAVTPSTSPIAFYDGTGHADGVNAGFVREESLLAVIMITDEDDCSTGNYDVFANRTPGNTSGPNGGDWGTNGNFYCKYAREENLLFPVQRYLEGFLATRVDPQDFIFAAIAGVPQETVQQVGQTCGSSADCGSAGLCRSGRCAPDFDAILAHPDMEEREAGTYLQPACRFDHPNNGDACQTAADCNAIGAVCNAGICDVEQVAYPAIRLVELARDLEAAGSNGVITTICQNNYRPAVDTIIRKIADVLGGSCLPRALNRDSSNKVPCDVVEILPTPDPTKPDLTTQCSQIPGRTRIRTEDGAEVCMVEQVTSANEGPGWYYDDTSPEVQSSCGMGGRRIAFAANSQPRAGTTVRLECLQPVQSQEITIGTPCTSNDDCADNNGRTAKYPNMICEPDSRTCQVGCSADVDCRTAGLGPHVCDRREDTPNICVNPTCQR